VIDTNELKKAAAPAEPVNVAGRGCPFCGCTMMVAAPQDCSGPYKMEYTIALAGSEDDRDDDDGTFVAKRVLVAHDEDRAVTLRRMTVSDLLELAAERLEAITYADLGTELVDDEMLVSELNERARTFRRAGA
jgi:hypothetical protein